MTNEILQCCYTNASQEAGGITSSGWRAVAVSPDLPPEAYAACVKLQNVNSTIQNTMVDENGNVLNLFEITGDGAYLYISRTQYGLLDRLGRANMFSHAFILPCREAAFISDPNNFLTIANENYKVCVEDALADVSGIVRTASIDMEEALELCRLSDDAYRTLIQCVYAQYSDKKASRPLYIQYDGTDTHMRHLLFCIYSAVPLSIRRNLSIASNATDYSVGKNIIFSIHAKSRELFVVPETGENNVLTPRIKRKISRLGFVDFAPENHVTLNEREYFHALEEKAAELGDVSASNELILKIAYQLWREPEAESMIGSIDNEELDIRLSDSLRSKSLGSRAMDQYIAILLDELIKRRLFLTKENEASLTMRLGSAADPALKEKAEKYEFYKFASLPLKDAAEQLSKMPTDIFNKRRRQLSPSPKGLKILDYYYSEIVLGDAEVTWEFLEQVLDGADFIVECPKTVERMGELAWMLYCNTLDNKVISQGLPILDIYDRYMEFMNKILPADEAEDCGNAAKKEYWKYKEFADVDLLEYKQYKTMDVMMPKCMMILEYCGLPQVYRDCGEKEFLFESNRFFCDVSETMTKENLSLWRKQLVQYMDYIYMGREKNFARWCNLYLLMPSSELAEVLQRVRDSRMDMNHLMQNYEEFVKKSSGYKPGTGLLRELSELLVKGCIEIDTDKEPVPLGIWLMLAGNLYPNSFELFNSVKPKVLYIDPQDAVAGCFLIKQSQYIHDAEDYINNKGEEAKQVKKWLAAVRQIRKQSSEEKSILLEKEDTDWEKPVILNAARESDHGIKKRLTDADSESLSGLRRGLFRRK